MDTKLTDFSPEQLAYLEKLVRNDWEIATTQIVELETIFVDGPALEGHETYKKWKKEQGLAAEWLTQIHTARVIVQSREAVNAN